MENDKKCCGHKCDEKCGEKCDHKCSGKKCYGMGHYGMKGCIYGLAFIGSLVYFLQNATSLWMGVVGIFKAIFWPAFLVYNLLGFLNM